MLIKHMLLLAFASTALASLAPARVAGALATNHLHPSIFGSAFRQGIVTPSRPSNRCEPFCQGTEAKYEAKNIEHYVRVLDRKLRLEERAVKRCVNAEVWASYVCELMTALLEQSSQSLQQQLANPEGDMRSRQRAVQQNSAVAAEFRMARAHYAPIVESCRGQRLEHERITRLLEEHRQEVVRRIVELQV